jgi:hypothetical protein
MMNTTSGKRLIPFLALAGLILAVGFVLYQAGFRVTTTATPPAGQQQTREPGQHQRRQALAEGQTGTQESAGGDQGGRASKRGAKGGKRSVEVRAGALGAEKIAVIGKGKEQSFTGADLEKLAQTTIASSRGARVGWRVADVMKHLTITQAKELVLVAQDGHTLNLPWEKITGREPTLLLTYNQFGGLMLLSGKELTPEEVQQGMDNQAIKTMAKQYGSEEIFFSKISKIEVKG